MRTTSVIFLVIFLLLTNLVKAQDFQCILTSDQTTYRWGEMPEVEVKIYNNTKEAVYFIGSLDGSDLKWRHPHCYFEIEKPTNDKPQAYGRCGNMNPLRAEDFVKVEPGKSFDPYTSVDHYGFFSAYNISDERQFRVPGRYKITFYYSTFSTKLEDYAGYGSEVPDLQTLLNQVPKVKLQSNTLVIDILR